MVHVAKYASHPYHADNSRHCLYHIAKAVAFDWQVPGMQTAFSAAHAVQLSSIVVPSQIASTLVSADHNVPV